MRNLSTVLAALAIAVPTVGNAIEFTGGTIALSYSAFTKDTSFSRRAGQGSFQIGFNKAFALQTDLSFYNYNATSLDGNDVTLHAIYNAGPSTSFGGFYGRDELSGANQNFYGVEFGTRAEAFGVEGFAEHGSQSGIDGTILGLSGHFTVVPSVTLGLAVQHAEFSGSVSATRIGLTGDYALSPNVKLYTEVGNLSGTVQGYSDNGNYVGVGAKITFGPNHGVAFAKRGLLEFIPGL